MDKKIFFFCMTVCNHRTGARIGKRCGVVFASNSDEAERIAWDKYGNDDTCLPWVEEVLLTATTLQFIKAKFRR